MTCASTASLKTLVVAALVVAAALAGAATLQTGDPLPALALKDQHANTLPVTADTRLIFLAAEMTSSKLMSKALEGLAPTALREGRAIYIADISSMPGPISIIVAMPKLQKLPYAVAVVKDGTQTAALPRKPGAVTVLKTQGGKITAVDYAATAEQVAAYLK
jgi:NADPH-dependent ferric siderophore reductase